MLGKLLWAALALGVLYTQAYTMLTRFLRLLLHTYFRKIELYGLNNLPREGTAPRSFALAFTRVPWGVSD